MQFSSSRTLPGPVVLHQHVDRRGRDAADVLVVLLGVLFEEVVGQQQDVRLALAQGRHVDREDVQPVVEIAPEGAVLDRLLEVAVGGRDDAHVDLDGALAADALELPLLQDAQQLDLDVEVERSPISSRKIVPRCASSNLPICCLMAPVKDALLVAEELAFDQVRRQRRAVDLDEGRAARAGCCSGWRWRRAPCRCRSRRGSARWRRCWQTWEIIVDFLHPACSCR